MAKLDILKGSTSISVDVLIGDSSVTTGAGKTGLAFNTASLVATYRRPGGAVTTITLATLANAQAAWSSGGFVEVDATNQPGIYRLDIPDAALATGARSVVVMLKGATNMVPVALEIQLTGVDNQDGVRGGMTALPNVAAGANGGLPTGNASAQVVAASIATGGITAASFASGAIDATAIATDAIGANELAASAITEIQAGLSTLDAAGVRTAVGLASANLDTQLSAIAGYIDTEVAAIKAKTDNLPASPAAVGSAMTLTSGERDAIAAAQLDLANGIETGLTERQALRLMVAALSGKLSGAATTTITIRNFGDSKDRITATVDSNGNRSAITYDLT